MVLPLNAYEAFWKDSKIRELHKQIGKERRIKKGETQRNERKLCRSLLTQDIGERSEE